jgi:hypothetical protein
VGGVIDEETIAEKSDRENIDFIKHLGYENQEELLKLAISRPIEDDDKSNLTWHYPKPNQI